VLIGSQVAISLVLLIASISFVRSFRSLATLDTGFRQDGLIFCFVDFSPLRLTSARIPVFQSELLDAVRRTSGIESVTSSTHVPLSGNSWSLEVRTPGREARGSAKFNWIGHSYFQTLGIPMIAGRSFAQYDSAVSKRVLIVNEAFVRQFFSDRPALGARVRSVAEPGFPETEYEIAGIVRDATYDSLQEKIPPVAYAPDEQNPELRPWTALIFRASASSENPVAGVGRVLAAKNPAMRLHFEVLRTMAEESLSRERLLAWLSGLFAVLASVLTCIGMYGVIAYIVSLRRSEIAVRIALGASSSQIAGMILRQTAMIAMAGAGGGLLLSLAGGRFARSLLFGVSPDDPLTLLAALSALITISFLASIQPALRAAFIQPAAGLRAE
jgi:predicted permease